MTVATTFYNVCRATTTYARKKAIIWCVQYNIHKPCDVNVKTAIVILESSLL